MKQDIYQNLIVYLSIMHFLEPPMYCKVACQIFSSTFAQKKKYSHFPEHSICQKLPKISLPQKVTTIKNYVQVHPNTSTAVKNGRIDSYWPSHRASRKSDVPLSGNHDFRSYGPYGPYLYPNSYRWNAWMLTNSNVQLSAYFAIISNIASTTNGLVDITLFSLIPTRNTFIFSIFSFQFINIT